MALADPQSQATGNVSESTSPHELTSVRSSCYYKVTYLVRTRYEEAARRYASSKRTAAAFPPAPKTTITSSTSRAMPSETSMGHVWKPPGKLGSSAKTFTNTKVKDVRQSNRWSFKSLGNLNQEPREPPVYTLGLGQSTAVLASPVVEEYEESMSMPLSSSIGEDELFQDNLQRMQIDLVPLARRPSVNKRPVFMPLPLTTEVSHNSTLTPARKKFMPPLLMETTKKNPVQHVRPIFKPAENSSNKNHASKPKTTSVSREEICLIDENSPPRPSYHLYRVNEDGKASELPITVERQMQSTSQKPFHFNEHRPSEMINDSFVNCSSQNDKENVYRNLGKSFQNFQQVRNKENGVCTPKEKIVVNKESKQMLGMVTCDLSSKTKVCSRDDDILLLEGERPNFIVLSSDSSPEIVTDKRQSPDSVNVVRSFHSQNTYKSTINSNTGSKNEHYFGETSEQGKSRLPEYLSDDELPDLFELATAGSKLTKGFVSTETEKSDGQVTGKSDGQVTGKSDGQITGQYPLELPDLDELDTKGSKLSKDFVPTENSRVHYSGQEELRLPGKELPTLQSKISKDFDPAKKSGFYGNGQNELELPDLDDLAPVETRFSNFAIGKRSEVHASGQKKLELPEVHELPTLGSKSLDLVSVEKSEAHVDGQNALELPDLDELAPVEKRFSNFALGKRSEVHTSGQNKLELPEVHELPTLGSKSLDLVSVEKSEAHVGGQNELELQDLGELAPVETRLSDFALAKRSEVHTSGQKKLELPELNELPTLGSKSLDFVSAKKSEVHKSEHKGIEVPDHDGLATLGSIKRGQENVEVTLADINREKVSNNEDDSSSIASTIIYEPKELPMEQEVPRDITKSMINNDFQTVCFKLFSSSSDEDAGQPVKDLPQSVKNFTDGNFEKSTKETIVKTCLIQNSKLPNLSEINKDVKTMVSENTNSKSNPVQVVNNLVMEGIECPQLNDLNKLEHNSVDSGQVVKNLVMEGVECPQLNDLDKLELPLVVDRFVAKAADNCETTQLKGSLDLPCNKIGDKTTTADLEFTDPSTNLFVKDGRVSFPLSILTDVENLSNGNSHSNSLVLKLRNSGNISCMLIHENLTNDNDSKLCENKDNNVTIEGKVCENALSSIAEDNASNSELPDNPKAEPENALDEIYELPPETENISSAGQVCSDVIKSEPENALDGMHKLPPETEEIPSAGQICSDVIKSEPENTLDGMHKLPPETEEIPSAGQVRSDVIKEFVPADSDISLQYSNSNFFHKSDHVESDDTIASDGTLEEQIFRDRHVHNMSEIRKDFALMGKRAEDIRKQKREVVDFSMSSSNNGIPKQIILEHTKYEERDDAKIDKENIENNVSEYKENNSTGSEAPLEKNSIVCEEMLIKQKSDCYEFIDPTTILFVNDGLASFPISIMNDAKKQDNSYISSLILKLRNSWHITYMHEDLMKEDNSKSCRNKDTNVTNEGNVSENAISCMIQDNASKSVIHDDSKARREHDLDKICRLPPETEDIPSTGLVCSDLTKEHIPNNSGMTSFPCSEVNFLKKTGRIENGGATLYGESLEERIFRERHVHIMSDMKKDFTLMDRRAEEMKQRKREARYFSLSSANQSIPNHEDYKEDDDGRINKIDLDSNVSRPKCKVKNTAGNKVHLGKGSQVYEEPESCDNHGCKIDRSSIFNTTTSVLCVSDTNDSKHLRALNIDDDRIIYCQRGCELVTAGLDSSTLEDIANKQNEDLARKNQDQNTDVLNETVANLQSSEFCNILSKRIGNDSLEFESDSVVALVDDCATAPENALQNEPESRIELPTPMEQFISVAQPVCYSRIVDIRDGSRIVGTLEIHNIERNMVIPDTCKVPARLRKDEKQTQSPKKEHPQFLNDGESVKATEKEGNEYLLSEFEEPRALEIDQHQPPKGELYKTPKGNQPQVLEGQQPLEPENEHEALTTGKSQAPMEKQTLTAMGNVSTVSQLHKRTEGKSITIEREGPLTIKYEPKPCEGQRSLTVRGEQSQTVEDKALKLYSAENPQTSTKEQPMVYSEKPSMFARKETHTSNATEQDQVYTSENRSGVGKLKEMENDTINVKVMKNFRSDLEAPSKKWLPNSSLLDMMKRVSEKIELLKARGSTSFSKKQLIKCQKDRQRDYDCVLDKFLERKHKLDKQGTREEAIKEVIASKCNETLTPANFKTPKEVSDTLKSGVENVTNGIYAIEPPKEIDSHEMADQCNMNSNNTRLESLDKKQLIKCQKELQRGYDGVLGREHKLIDQEKQEEATKETMSTKYSETLTPANFKTLKEMSDTQESGVENVTSEIGDIDPPKEIHSNEMADQSNMNSNEMADQSNMNSNEMADQSNMNSNEMADQSNMNSNEMADQSNMNSNEMADQSNMNSNEMADQSNMNSNEMADQSNMNSNEMADQSNMNSNEMADQSNMNSNEMADQSNMNSNEMADQSNMNSNDACLKTLICEEKLCTENITSEYSVECLANEFSNTLVIDSNYIFQPRSGVHNVFVNNHQDESHARLQQIPYSLMNSTFKDGHKDTLNSSQFHLSKYTYVHNNTLEQSSENQMQDFDITFSGCIQRSDTLIGGHGESQKNTNDRKQGSFPVSLNTDTDQANGELQALARLSQIHKSNDDIDICCGNSELVLGMGVKNSTFEAGHEEMANSSQFPLGKDSHVHNDTLQQSSENQMQDFEKAFSGCVQRSDTLIGRHGDAGESQKEARDMQDMSMTNNRKEGSFSVSLDIDTDQTIGELQVLAKLAQTHKNNDQIDICRENSEWEGDCENKFDVCKTPNDLDSTPRCPDDIIFLGTNGENVNKRKNIEEPWTGVHAVGDGSNTRVRKKQRTSYRVLQVPMSDACQEGLRLLIKTGESLLASLRKNTNDLFKLDLDFLNLKVELTRTLLHQFVRTVKINPHPKNPDTCRYRILLTIHGLVKATDLLFHYGLESTIQCLKSYVIVHRALLKDSYNDILPELDRLFEVDEKTIVPKVASLKEMLTKEKKIVDMCDTNFKVLVVCKREGEVVGRQLKKGLGEKAVRNFIGKPENNSILNHIDQHSVIVWSEIADMERIPCCQFNLMVEWETSEGHQSSAAKCCVRQNVDVIGLILDMKVLKGSKDEKPATEVNKDSKDTPAYSSKSDKSKHKLGKEMALATPTEGAEENDEDKPDTFTFVASERLINNAELHYILTSVFNINLVERRRRDLVHCDEIERGWADVVVDERTCILLRPLEVLKMVSTFNAISKELVLLSLQVSRCYLLLYQDPPSDGGYGFRNKVLKNLNHLTVLCGVLKSRDYQVTVLYASNLQQVGKLIRGIGESARDSSHFSDKEEWTRRPWLTANITSHERFLLTLPCLNPISAQIILAALTLRKVLTMSLENLIESLSWIPLKVVKDMYHMLHFNDKVGFKDELLETVVKDEDTGSLLIGEEYQSLDVKDIFPVVPKQECSLENFSQTAFSGDLFDGSQLSQRDMTNADTPMSVWSSDIRPSSIMLGENHGSHNPIQSQEILTKMDSGHSSSANQMVSHSMLDPRQFLKSVSGEAMHQEQEIPQSTFVSPLDIQEQDIDMNKSSQDSQSILQPPYFRKTSQIQYYQNQPERLAPVGQMPLIYSRGNVDAFQQNAPLDSHSSLPSLQGNVYQNHTRWYQIEPQSSGSVISPYFVNSCQTHSDKDGFLVPPSQPLISNIPSSQPLISNIPSSQPLINNIPPSQPFISNIPPSQPLISNIPPSQPLIRSIPQSQPLISSIPPTQPLISSSQIPIQSSSLYMYGTQSQSLPNASSQHPVVVRGFQNARKNQRYQSLPGESSYNSVPISQRLFTSPPGNVVVGVATPYQRESTPIPPPSPRVTLRQSGRGHDYPEHYNHPSSQISTPRKDHRNSNLRLTYSKIPGSGGQTKLTVRPRLKPHHGYSVGPYTPRQVNAQDTFPSSQTETPSLSPADSTSVKLGYSKTKGAGGQTKLTFHR